MNLVIDTEFKAEFPVFTGSFRKAKLSGYAKVTGKIVDENYSGSTSLHWFKFLVIESDSTDYEVGKTYRKRGKNMYPNIKEAKYGSNYEEHSQDKKHRAQVMKLERKNLYI